MSENNHTHQRLYSLASSRPHLLEKYHFADTNTSEVSTYDAESVRSIDQLSTARASVAVLDKLWTQIDVLDDVKLMAEDVKKRGSFFNEDYITLLLEMKSAQRKLQEVVTRHQEANDRTRMERNEDRHEIDRVWGLAEGDMEKETEITKQKMQNFFFLQDSESQGNQQKDFDHLNDYVREVLDGLEVVGLRMKNFDDATKKLW